MKRAPDDRLADAIWRSLRLVRADKVVNTPTGKPGQFTQHLHGGELHTGEEQDFHACCARLTVAASKAGADLSALADRINDAFDFAQVEAAKARAAQLNRLGPADRAEYRKRSAQASDLARWLANELTERETATAADGLGVVHNWRDPARDGRNVETLGDLLPQRLGRVSEGEDPEHVLSAALTGRKVDAKSTPELHRAAELVGSLRWIAELLIADAERAKPAKRPPAIWKPTARVLRDDFAELLGAPHLADVATLAGLAFRCELPLSELSKLGKG